MLTLYKIATASTALVAVVMAALAYYHARANPVVVIEECGEKVFHEGRRQAIKITDDDVMGFIENWIKLRYAWTEYEPEKIVRQIAPLSTDGLQAKLKETLGKKAAQDAKAKSGSQQQRLEENVTNIRVTLTDKDAVAAFDRIVRINGIPIIVPSEVAFQIIQGTPTQWNPLGLFVNGIVERDEK